MDKERQPATAASVSHGRKAGDKLCRRPVIPSSAQIDQEGSCLEPFGRLVHVRDQSRAGFGTPVATNRYPKKIPCPVEFYEVQGFHETDNDERIQ